MAALFRIALQCQIIDDVLDCDDDVSRRLPGFLTALPSLSESAALTAEASRTYGSGLAGSRVILPLRLALRLVTMMASGCARLAQWRYRITDSHEIRHRNVSVRS
jgi:hypothetical protein